MTRLSAQAIQADIVDRLNQSNQVPEVSIQSMRLQSLTTARLFHANTLDDLLATAETIYQWLVR